jgi:hypothetical protein
MKIIYTLAVEEDGLSPDERPGRSALIGHLETQAHQWMMDHHPDVAFNTQHIASTVPGQFDCRLDDCRKHHHVVADTEAEQAQGEQILAGLHDYLCRQWQKWRAERGVGSS